MKNICFYFQVHQPFRLKRYRFFDIGKDVSYFDDSANRSIMNKVAEKCYLPMNLLLLKLIKKHKGEFKVAFSISGTAIEQMELYAPKVLDSFKELAKTGCVEFLAETYYHSLSSISDTEVFEDQVLKHKQKVEFLFGQVPTVFRNTELIYSDLIGARVGKMGFKGMLAEGVDGILGKRSPNVLYVNPFMPSLKLLLRNYRLSDDIAFRFSNQGWAEWPLTVEKYLKWLKETAITDQVVNIFMDYETFGEHQWASTGIFNFMEMLPAAILKSKEFNFATPSEIVESLTPVDAISVQTNVSWADVERDLSAWLGNGMQDNAFEKIFSLSAAVDKLADDSLKSIWGKLQTSDHFYYMCIKWLADGDVHKYFNHYSSPYEAFITYMNVVSDFEMHVNRGLELQNKVQVSLQKDMVEEKSSAQPTDPMCYLG
ncbi:glycoside hydrolase family 57 protein [Alistipes sp. ZOR0009]|uniref:glycoside hydrolase family 57 protein n=1 Tax=Alistipes sp. ZOR0009 TaxID=1339253 RepID=UPI0006485A6D|nr:glycoside hydrolase family 57 protein [Alistipes sp. ZOR0009]